LTAKRREDELPGDDWISETDVFDPEGSFVDSFYLKYSEKDAKSWSARKPFDSIIVNQESVISQRRDLYSLRMSGGAKFHKKTRSAARAKNEILMIRGVAGRPESHQALRRFLGKIATTQSRS
jgi:hypothetical protein